MALWARPKLRFSSKGNREPRYGLHRGGLIRFGVWKGYSEVACGGEVGRAAGR